MAKEIKKTYEDGYYDGYKAALNALIKFAHWIKIDNLGEPEYMCSNCGYVDNDPTSTCPNCSSYMEEEMTEINTDNLFIEDGCNSESCPKYKECARSVFNNAFMVECEMDTKDYLNKRTVTYRDGDEDIYTYVCGPKGNYGMYEQK